jgi:hypothetical protein
MLECGCFVAHLEENTVIGFVSDKLSEDERRSVEEHVDTCASCRKLLAAMGADSSLLTPYAGTLESAAPKRPGDDLVSQLKPGENVGDRYTLVKPLGRGGMGYVFQATDNELHVDVALKLLRPELTRDDEQVRHLRREILAGRAISHPNACRMFDLGKDERFYFITMEFVDGVTLEERMKALRLSTAQAVEILDTLLSVLAAAHREGIVHRDLKPANLMFDAKDRIKVMDFGLARDLKGETSLAGAVGTPAFWAPEQARGEPAGPTADVFAVGVIAYLALTGAVSTASITRRLDRVPAQYRGWVATCLAEDPAERYADGAAAQVAFARARESKPRNVRVIAGALVGVAAVGALGIGWFATRASALPARTEPTPSAQGSAPAVPVASPPDAAVPVAADAGVVQAPADATIDAASPRKGASDRPRPVEHRDAGTSTAPVEVRPDASSLLYE